MNTHPNRILSLRKESILDPEDGSSVAAVVGTNLLDPAWTILGANDARAWLVRSGWIAQEGDEPGQAWLPRHRSEFDAGATRFARLATSAGATPVLWPRATDTVSDIPSLQSFLRSEGGQAWRVLADPVGLLTPSMMDSAEEHLARLFDVLPAMSQTWALLLRDVEERAGVLEPAPLRAGSVLTECVIALAARAAHETGVRIVLLEQELASQRALLDIAKTKAARA